VLGGIVSKLAFYQSSPAAPTPAEPPRFAAGNAPPVSYVPQPGVFACARDPWIGLRGSAARLAYREHAQRV